MCKVRALNTAAIMDLQTIRRVVTSGQLGYGFESDPVSLPLPSSMGATSRNYPNPEISPRVYYLRARRKLVNRGIETALEREREREGRITFHKGKGSTTIIKLNSWKGERGKRLCLGNLLMVDKGARFTPRPFRVTIEINYGNKL